MEKVQTVCGLCNCECGIVGSIENGRLIQLSGDADCPLNRGAVCSKAMALEQLVYDPERITRPMKKDRSGNWQPID